MARTTKALFAGLCAAALAVTGCGLGGGGDDAGTTQEGTGTDDIGAAIAEVTDEELQGTSITMARFFGDCDDTTQGVTDMAQARTECEAIQILTNKFVEENQWGIEIERLGGAAWHSYYDSLNAALASPDRPDIAVMHGSNLPEYAERGLLLDASFAPGVDLGDTTAPASAAIDYDGTMYGIPFDTHAVISHLNLDLLGEAGLLEDDGTYAMPTSTEEFLADAKQFKDATGKTFIDIAMTNDPMASRMWMALVWQQGEEFIDVESGEAMMDSEAGKAALEFLVELAKNGYSNVTNDYDASFQAFLRGDAGIMYNGVWAVNQFEADAPFEYATTDAPMLFSENVTWADSHTWTVPVQEDPDPVKYRAAFELAKFLYEHSSDWAVATGHMPSSEAALNSDAYLAAPHRNEYLDTAREFGHVPPRVVQWPAVSAAIQSDLEAAWLNDQPVDDTLATLQADTESALG